ncbi:hypothetical protein SO802_034391 [Lithocarpus litseifolius]|uniref:Uncharacterized protein n=1 Tax=Lithocarpus litseifolius TaxID=425828 RepID=A0AAW2BHX5_9ROSI
MTPRRLQRRGRAPVVRGEEEMVWLGVGKLLIGGVTSHLLPAPDRIYSLFSLGAFSGCLFGSPIESALHDSFAGFSSETIWLFLTNGYDTDSSKFASDQCVTLEYGELIFCWLVKGLCTTTTFEPAYSMYYIDVGADIRYKSLIIRMYGRKSEKEDGPTCGLIDGAY